MAAGGKGNKKGKRFAREIKGLTGIPDRKYVASTRFFAMKINS
jgi:hypothetical protein